MKSFSRKRTCRASLEDSGASKDKKELEVLVSQLYKKIGQPKLK
jgi:hypothetical protein